MPFTVEQTDPRSAARAGVFQTEHGPIHTPIFMPVGTVGSVKAVRPEELRDPIGAEIILGNTYHLYLRPGTDLLHKAGGLHRFTGWDRAMLTDSGGFQVYSLAGRRKITEKGVTFRSHIDGSSHIFTPENVVDTQRQIGADILMAFDECPPWPCTYEYAKDSMEMTHRWLQRCLQRMEETQPLYGYTQWLFPIVQGSTFPDLRKQSAEVIAEAAAEGNAIGGLSVGEPAEEMYAMTDLVCGILPADKPRYLMGVGTPANILESIALGVDMFDCVMPTRNARHGMLYTSEGIINIKNLKWKEDFSPIDAHSPATQSRQTSKAYLRHLFLTKEILALQIASLHNLAFYLELVREARRQILQGTFSSWKDQMLPRVSQRL